MNFTMFTCPRAFKGEHDIIQNNALASWRAFPAIKPEILLMGDDFGVDRAAKRWDCIHVLNVRKNEYGTPFVRSVFWQAQAVARHKLMLYANSDILFWMPALTEALRRVSEVFPQFLMIGQRHDFYHPHYIDFSDWGDQQFLHRAKKKGTLHGPAGLDYFAFPKGQIGDIDDYYLGRRAWDNAIAHDALKRHIPVIDATEILLAIHIGKTTNKPITPEIQHNRALAGNAGTWGRTTFATWRLGPYHDVYK